MSASDSLLFRAEFFLAVREPFLMDTRLRIQYIDMEYEHGIRVQNKAKMETRPRKAGISGRWHEGDALGLPNVSEFTSPRLQPT